MQKRESLLLCLGLALFWPFFSYRVSPSMFLRPDVLERPSLEGAGIFLEAALYLFSSVAISLWSARKADRKPSLKTIVGVCLFLLASCLALLQYPAFPTSLRFSLHVAIRALSGAYAGVLTIAWANAVGTTRTKLIFTMLAASLLLNFIFVTAVQVVASQTGFLSPPAAAAFLPLLSGIAFLVGSFTASKSKSTRPILHRLCHDPFAKMALILVFYLLSSYMFSGLYAREGDFSTTALSKAVAIAIALIVLVLMYRTDLKGATSIYPYMIFVVVCMVASCFALSFGGQMASLCLELVLPTRVHAMFYVWVAAFACAKRNGWLFDSTTLFLFVPMITICFSLDGLGDFMPTGLASLWTASFVMFAGTVLSVLLLVFGLMGIVKTSTEEETLAEGYDANNEFNRRKCACTTMTSEFGLTPREEEVLLLLSQGHSQKKIADVLFISPNSSKTYTKSIYRKTNLHSKQEIMDEIERRMALPTVGH